MDFFFLLFFIIKLISPKNLLQIYSQILNSSKDIINVFPYEKIKVTQKDNEPLYFSFSSNSIYEENNTFVFDFYKGFSENSKIYIYLDYNNFQNDKQNGNFNKANYQGTILDKIIGYDAYQLGFTIKKIDKIYFVIHNKVEKNRQYIFNVYDYSYLIKITNSFYNDFYYQSSLFYNKKIYMLLKSESPIYFIYQFHSNKTTSLGNKFKLIFYKNNLNNTVKELTSSSIYYHELKGYFLLEDNSSYILTIEVSFSYLNYDHFYFNGYYSNVPYFVYSIDNNENNFNYSFITANNVYYYKNITSNTVNENFEFELCLYDSYNEKLSSKPIGFYIYYRNVENFDVYEMPMVNDYVSLNEKKGNLMFSIKKKNTYEKFIIIRLSNSNYNYLQEIKANIKFIVSKETHYFRNFMIFLIIIIIIIAIKRLYKRIISYLKIKVTSKNIDIPEEKTYPPMIQCQTNLPTLNEVNQNNNFSPAPPLENNINHYPAAPNNIYDKPTQGYN